MNIFSLGSRVRDYSSAEIRRVIYPSSAPNPDDTSPGQAPGPTVRIMAGNGAKNSVTLAPMKSLAVEEFSFPFQNAGKISDALRLQAQPYTAGGGVEIFPVTLSQKGRSSDGIAWYVSPSELDFPPSGNTWPSPLPLVSGLSDFGGFGVTMWADEENICSILWQNFIPVMYRWKKRSDDDSELREMSFYDSYCAARNFDRGGNFVINAAAGGYDIADIITESVRICPWIAGVNLSRSVLEGARDLERTLSRFSRILLWLSVSGVIMLCGQLLRWYHSESVIDRERVRAETFYRETFDPSRQGRISNPVTLARDRIASLRGTEDSGHSLEEVLSDMGAVYSSSEGITVDIMRYNADGIDCTGTASDMTAALNFRRAWEERANMVQVDNTQFVSGIGYRFDLRIRW